MKFKRQLCCTTLRVVRITTRIGCDFFGAEESTHHAPRNVASETKGFWTEEITRSVMGTTKITA